jgi:hypothetical protein
LKQLYSLVKQLKNLEIKTMKMITLFKTTLTASVLTLALADPAAAQGWGTGQWDGGDGSDTAAVLGLNSTLTSTAANANVKSWSDNAALTYNAWGMTGGWLSFNLTSASDMIIKATADGNTQAPAFTLYRTNGFYAGDTVGPEGGSNGQVHSFSGVAQTGQNGFIWATATGAGPGIVDTLAYANSGNAHAANAFGHPVNAGFNQVDMSNLYATSMTGTGVAGSGLAEIDLKNLAAGYYSIFVGGANAALAGSPINVSVSSVPVPGAVWLFGSALMGLVGAQHKKMAKMIA